MGKAALRRRTRRQAYLSRLSRENPAKFQTEWSKRLASWSSEAKRRAGQLTDDEGVPVPPAFAVISQALNELAAYGHEAFDLEGSETEETMTDSCCRAFADAVYPRMYRLTNMRSNYHKMKSGTHKPPR